MMTVNTVALLQLLLSASDASFSGDNMNGEVGNPVLKPPPQWVDVCC